MYFNITFFIIHYTIWAGYVIISINHCPFAAIYCLMTQCPEGGQQFKRGREEGREDSHSHRCAWPRHIRCDFTFYSRRRHATRSLHSKFCFFLLSTKINFVRSSFLDFW